MKALAIITNRLVAPNTMNYLVLVNTKKQKHYVWLAQPNITNPELCQEYNRRLEDPTLDSHIVVSKEHKNFNFINKNFNTKEIIENVMEQGQKKIYIVNENNSVEEEAKSKDINYSNVTELVSFHQVGLKDYWMAAVKDSDKLVQISNIDAKKHLPHLIFQFHKSKFQKPKTKE